MQAKLGRIAGYDRYFGKMKKRCSELQVVAGQRVEKRARTAEAAGFEFEFAFASVSLPSQVMEKMSR